jgi:HEAT repeat protein
VTPPPAAQPADSPRFDYRVLECSSFDEVLRGSGDEVTLDEFVQRALDHGRVLLQARGGSGKSETLRRLRAVGTERGLRVVEVWAVSWVNQVINDEQVATTAALVDAVASSSSPAVNASTFTDDRPTLLLIDGLNEVQSDYVLPLLAAVDILASRNPHLGVVVADRLTRRAVDTERWVLATLTAVPRAQIREFLGDAIGEDKLDLFANPYFLERARLDPASAAAHRSFFESQLGLDKATLSRLAAATNESYRVRRDRLNAQGYLAEKVGAEVVHNLVAAGVITRGAEYEWFSHHLMADYLAALDASSNEDRWNRVEFDALTFRASSFDALSMLLDEVENKDVDLLVRRVHDWNLYAAAHLIADDQMRSQRVSEDMKVALLGMLAERRFDRMLATAEQVTDALRLQSSPLATRLLAATGPSEVLDIVGSYEGETTWFNDWKALFTRQVGPAGAEDVALLTNADGVLGWTAANVLKRLGLSPSATGEAIELLGHEDPTVRWRAAHALGASPDPRVVERLLSVFTSKDDLWVQYGALRSLIEIARSGSPSVRRKVFTRLGQIASHINDSPQLKKEASRALRVIDSPAGWSEDAGLMVERLWGAGRTVADQDLWRSVSAQLQRIERAS